MGQEASLKTEETIEESVENTNSDTALEGSDSETSESSWEGLADSFDEADGADFEAEPEVEEVEETPAPVAEEKEEPEVLKEEPVAEEKKEETPAQEKPQAVKEEPKAQPQQTEEERQAVRGQAVERLTQSYQLSKEDAETLEVNPAEALPKFAAELHLRVYDDVVNSLVQQMPKLMDWHLSAKQEGEAREGAFYSAWPELKGYEGEVLQIARMWREMNPAAEEQAAIQAIGKIALGALDIRRGEAVSPQPSAQPSVANVTRSSPPVSSRSAQAANRNPFEALDAAWDVEDVD